MNKKLMSMFMIGLLSCGMLVGCGNDTEVQYQEPTQQQEEYQAPVDEDLTPQYKEEINKKNELEFAKIVIEATAEESIKDFEWKVVTNEEGNMVVLQINLTETQALALINGGYWDGLVEEYEQNVKEIQKTLNENGISVNYGVMWGDINNDEFWFFVTSNTGIVYDITDDLK